MPNGTAAHMISSLVITREGTISAAKMDIMAHETACNMQHGRHHSSVICFQRQYGHKTNYLNEQVNTNIYHWAGASYEAVQ